MPQEFRALHTSTFHSCLWQGGTQPLSYCCPHLHSATELAHRKAISPFFLACIYVVPSPTELTHRCTSFNFPVFSHTVIPPPSPSSSGTGEHYLYLQPVTCLADPYPTQTFLLLCPALVHLSALPPLLLTPRYCFLGFVSILSLAYWKLCAFCRVPDICTFILLVLQNPCCQLNSSPTNLLLGMLLGSSAGSRVGGQPTPPAQTVPLQCPPHPCASNQSHRGNPNISCRTAFLGAGNLTLRLTGAVCCS